MTLVFWFYLDLALGLHQLQFGLSQLQLHLPQLVLQTLLLLVRLLAAARGRGGHGGAHSTLFVEEAAALLTALHFGLEEDQTHTERVRADILTRRTWKIAFSYCFGFINSVNLWSKFKK